MNEDNQLDGLELFKAITHVVEEQMDSRRQGGADTLNDIYKEKVRRQLVGNLDC